MNLESVTEENAQYRHGRATAEGEGQTKYDQKCINGRTKFELEK